MTWEGMPARSNEEFGDLTTRTITMVGEQVYPNGIQHVEVILNNAQILALFNVGDLVEIVPAPGTGKILHYLGGAIISNIVTPYTAISTDDCEILFKLNTNAQISAIIVNDATHTLASDLLTGSYYFSMVPAIQASDDWGNIAARRLVSTFADTPINLQGYNNDVTLTGGGAGNTLTATVLYAELDV